MAIFEEHRYHMPFAYLENFLSNAKFGLALHSLPSPLKSEHLSDHWCLFGITYNNQRNVSKALQSKAMKFPDTYFNLEPRTVIEKTFYLDVYPVSKQGTSFQWPLYSSLDIFKPYFTEDLPEIQDIVESKVRFAQSPWIEGEDYAAQHILDTAWYPNSTAEGFYIFKCSSSV